MWMPQPNGTRRLECRPQESTGWAARRGSLRVERNFVSRPRAAGKPLPSAGRPPCADAAFRGGLCLRRSMSAQDRIRATHARTSLSHWPGMPGGCIRPAERSAYAVHRAASAASTLRTLAKSSGRMPIGSDHDAALAAIRVNSSPSVRYSASRSPSVQSGGPCPRFGAVAEKIPSTTSRLIGDRRHRAARSWAGASECSGDRALLCMPPPVTRMPREASVRPQTRRLAPVPTQRADPCPRPLPSPKGRSRRHSRMHRRMPPPPRR
jgi:hypothetical protein